MPKKNKKKRKQTQHAGKWSPGSVVPVFYVGHLAQSFSSQQFFLLLQWIQIISNGWINKNLIDIASWNYGFIHSATCSQTDMLQRKKVRKRGEREREREEERETLKDTELFHQNMPKWSVTFLFQTLEHFPLYSSKVFNHSDSIWLDFPLHIIYLKK